ncbi:four-carbon acid sugar kinase family protein [Propioniciclava sinopodophylli]|uniref:3-oxo-tetronate kinase n=1 Tax=Propioniciclava sinopodophylli TaxID=1837344 RepID=A0A4Q9KDQ4_9ACTN|nr:3-oxo-tetronate kinase [Propioniciclava sinopodophylli]TBT84952.1 four-carbon acid sugar kinase family protein [Propioniciclava sinopodophylli]
MTIRLGVIADDFTGATDIAGFLVSNGLSAVQVNGVPEGPLPQADAIVVSLKSRSIPADEAVSMSLAALDALRAAGAERILFKYCSTFDSTPAGNIGPVTDALMAALGADLTVICPSLPVNGRTVYQGHLFVGDVLLSESGMRNHPVTPMTDPNLVRVMEAQSSGRAGVVPFAVIQQGPDATRAALARLAEDGVRYAVLDTLTDVDLTTIGAATVDLPLTTGGSGLGAGVARALATGTDGVQSAPWQPVEGRTVVLSGSCSVMTNAQVAAYRADAPALSVDVDRLVADPDAYRAEVLAWVLAQPAEPAPLVYATAGPDEVSRLQEAHGAAEVSEAVEALFGWLARELSAAGVRRFVVAGGETSGSVTTALGVDGFHVGPQIAPGVPWVRSLDDRTELALKSGNFGDVDFFTRAQA